MHSHATGASRRKDAHGATISGGGWLTLARRQAEKSSRSHSSPPQPSWHKHRPLSSSQTPCLPHPAGLQGFDKRNGTSDNPLLRTSSRPASGSTPTASITFGIPTVHYLRSPQLWNSRTASTDVQYTVVWPINSRKKSANTLNTRGNLRELSATKDPRGS